ncbi:MAG: hypothetical protein H7326_03655 [Bdellovibrionaceae bacterium]|nr:hypothetical protein [Pseudobdellovibrionaceae bacterium]
MPQELLKKLKNDLDQKAGHLRIRGQLHLTKSQPAYCDAVLLRDVSLENDVSGWIDERTSWSDLLDRYQSMDPELISGQPPEHFAVRVLSGRGSICSGKNIFLFFPHCLGITETDSSESFGLELVDVWRNVFEKVVFPCARSVLDSESLVAALPGLLHAIEKTTYLASVFHEIGHRIGPWKVSPKPNEKLRVDSFYLDILGELSTDCALVKNLSPFPEINSFVTLQRMFWFGRRGYLDNPKSAWLNTDNDSWISAFLWNELTRQKLLQKNGDKWNLKFSELPGFYSELYSEIQDLGLEVLRHSTKLMQNQIVEHWMRSKVDWDPLAGFALSESQQDAFASCARYPEIPQFNPILDLNPQEML